MAEENKLSANRRKTSSSGFFGLEQLSWHINVGVGVTLARQ